MDGESVERARTLEQGGIIVNPTGHGVRGHDAYGSGAYNASRTSNGRHRLHGGIDFVVVPGQLVVSPIDGIIVRECRPYINREGAFNTGILIEADEREALAVKMFYCKPLPDIIGVVVRAGDPVAKAVSLQEVYDGISEHVHLEVWQGGRRIDPMPFFNGLHIEAPPLTA